MARSFAKVVCAATYRNAQPEHQRLGIHTMGYLSVQRHRSPAPSEVGRRDSPFIVAGSRTT